MGRSVVLAMQLASVDGASHWLRRGGSRLDPQPIIASLQPLHNLQDVNSPVVQLEFALSAAFQ